MKAQRLRDTRSFDEWTPRSYLICANRVVDRNSGAARILGRDDAIGEALLGIARAIASHNPEKGPPLYWAIRKATGVVWEAVRVSQTRYPPAVPLEDAPEEALWAEQADSPPVEMLVRLTPKQREVAVLAMDGLTCKQIAKAVGLSEPRVHQLRREARERLKEVVG